MSSLIKKVLDIEIPEVKLDIKKLKPGIINSYDLYDNFGKIVIESYTEITQRMLDTLIKRKVKFLYYNPETINKVGNVAGLSVDKPIIEEEIQEEAFEYAREVLDFVREIYDFNPKKNIISDKLEKARDLVNRIIENIEKNRNAVFIPLKKLKDLDEYTYLHSSCVSFIGAILGTKLNVKKDLRVRMGVGGLLHDIGKSAVNREILCKPGRLTKEEFDEIKIHPHEGHNLLENIPHIYKMEKNIVLYHHERADGTGYPFGYDYRTYREKIPRLVRMMSICDVYSALINSRPYKDAYPPQKALRIIFNGMFAPFKKDYQFLPVDVRDFIKAIGFVLNSGNFIFDRDEVVRLNTGEIGIVTRMDKLFPLDPVVQVISDNNLTRLKRPITVDLNVDHTRHIAYLYNLNTSEA